MSENITARGVRYAEREREREREKKNKKRLVQIVE
jgi:hypothetical protein